MLIDIRIGPGRWKLKSIMQSVETECEKVQRAPHLTLYGPFNAGRTRLEKLKQIIESCCGNCLYLPFSVDDYEFRESPKVKGWMLAFKILPSESLERFRDNLVEELKRLASSIQSVDNGNSPFWFHVSLALNLRKSEVDKAWSFLHEGSHSALDSLPDFIGLRKIEETCFCIL